MLEQLFQQLQWLQHLRRSNWRKVTFYSVIRKSSTGAKYRVLAIVTQARTRRGYRIRYQGLSRRPITDAECSEEQRKELKTWNRDEEKRTRLLRLSALRRFVVGKGEPLQTCVKQAR